MTPTWSLHGSATPEPTTADEQAPAPNPDRAPAPALAPDRAPAPDAEALDGAAEPQPAESEPDPESEPPSGSEPEGAGSEASAARPSNGRLRKAGLAGAAVLLVLGGCGFLYGAHQLRSQAPARNQALTDTEATTRVVGDVGNALARVFSYTPDGTAAAERSASTVLDGRAARQYEALFARVRDDLTDQRVTLTTRAVRTGVIELDGDEARLLVFLDQTSHRDKAAATTAAAQLTVTARLEDDRWRIVDIKAR